MPIGAFVVERFKRRLQDFHTSRVPTFCAGSPVTSSTCCSSCARTATEFVSACVKGGGSKTSRPCPLRDSELASLLSHPCYQALVASAEACYSAFLAEKGAGAKQV
jgi:hypothetical protein